MQVALRVDLGGFLVPYTFEGYLALPVHRERHVCAGVVFAEASALQVWHAPVGTAGHGRVAVSAKNQVYRTALAEAVCCIIRSPVDQEDGGVALPGRLKGSGEAVDCLIINGDGVPLAGKLRGHDAAGVIDCVSDYADLDLHRLPGGVDGLFFYYHIVFCTGDAGAVAVKVGADDWHFVDAGGAVALIIGKGGVLVRHIVESPVEFMVAQGDGVVFHQVHRNVNGLAGLQVGNAGALIEVAAVEKEEAPFVVGVSAATYVFYLIRYVGQAIVHLVCVHIHDISVHVCGLDNRQHIVAGLGEHLDRLLRFIRHGRAVSGAPVAGNAIRSRHYGGRQKNMFHHSDSTQCMQI